MRRAQIIVNGEVAAELIEHSIKHYELVYAKNYTGTSISLTLPKKSEPYVFKSFPTFFEGFLPEGIMLMSLLKTQKIDKNDFFSQLVIVGLDLVGGLTIKEIR